MASRLTDEPAGEVIPVQSGFPNTSRIPLGATIVIAVLCINMPSKLTTFENALLVKAFNMQYNAALECRESS